VTDFRTLRQTYDDGGVFADLSSSDDKYVFCSPAVSGESVGAAFFPVGRDRYNIGSLYLETATAPSWDNN